MNCDGASENRSVLKQLAHYSIEDLLIEPISKLCPKLLQTIPLDFPIAFDHPTVTEIIIFISSDTPHFNKKFVNALERSSNPSEKTSLSYLGQPISLGILHELWQRSGDGGNMSSLRLYKFTTDHFEVSFHNFQQPPPLPHATI